MFRSEPFILVGDVIRRETQTYDAVLKAIAAGPPDAAGDRCYAGPDIFLPEPLPQAIGGAALDRAPSAG
ncbi:MAG: hypothetical protein V3T90_04215, partial [Anaerolineae bacterium]